MWVERIALNYFKNYQERSFEFTEGINCIVGENGVGKTNLLDAVYLLALTKSAFHNQDAQSLSHGADYFLVKGLFNIDQAPLEVSVGLKAGQKKAVFVNGSPYARLSDHVGRLPVVLVTPNDTDLVRGASEGRRRFFDNVWSQYHHPYLIDLLAYNRLLNQRNAVLRLFNERRNFDADLLESIDVQLIPLANSVHQYRKDFIQEFSGQFVGTYSFISGSQENVSIRYESQLTELGFESKFRKSRQNDVSKERTLLGIHQDSYEFLVNETPIRKFGSQGQQKTFVLALKFAQAKLLSNSSGTSPIMLLDDLFDRLDDSRIRQTLELLRAEKLQQVLITEARPKEALEIFKKQQLSVNFIALG